MSNEPQTHYTPREVANRIGVTTEHVRRLVREGHIKVIRFSTYGRMRIPADEVKRLETPHNM